MQHLSPSVWTAVGARTVLRALHSCANAVGRGWARILAADNAALALEMAEHEDLQEESEEEEKSSSAQASQGREH